MQLPNVRVQSSGTQMWKHTEMQHGRKNKVFFFFFFPSLLCNLKRSKSYAPGCRHGWSREKSLTLPLNKISKLWDINIVADLWMTKNISCLPFCAALKCPRWWKMSPSMKTLRSRLADSRHCHVQWCLRKTREDYNLLDSLKSFILLIWKVTNYLLLFSLSGFGLGFITLELWFTERNNEIFWGN